MLLDINASNLSSNPDQIVAIGSTVSFTADDAVRGVELWKSDGTAAGTTLVKDMRPGCSSSGPRDLTDVNGKLLFTAFEQSTGWEVWKRDRTAAGTMLVKGLCPGSSSSWAGKLTPVNGMLYFTSDDGSGVYKLWQSGCTPTGTVIATSMAAKSLTNINGALFFRAGDGIHGWELWKLVDDSAPVPRSMSINDVTIIEGHSGTANATFTAMLSAASSQTVTVKYTIAVVRRTRRATVRPKQARSGSRRE